MSELVYVSQDSGIRRRRRGRGFGYVDDDGRRVTDRATLARIRTLAIPPAWKSVWICADPRGHLQATGRDARGRKQYRYHELWVKQRGEDKFDELRLFGEALPRLRREAASALATHSLSRDRVLAAVVSILDSTFARVGNAEYRRDNGSFGIATLESRHASGTADRVRLAFRGKAGVFHELEIRDPRVARVVRRCQALPGQPLFQYVDEDGAAHAVRSQDVNEWLRDKAGRDLTAKQFRTWHGSSMALAAFLARERPAAPISESAGRALVAEVVTEVAKRLGNTRAVCRKHYIHPGLLAAALAGKLHEEIENLAPTPRRGMPAAEARLLAWLEKPAGRLAGRGRTALAGPGMPAGGARARNQTPGAVAMSKRSLAASSSPG